MHKKSSPKGQIYVPVASQMEGSEFGAKSKLVQWCSLTSSRITTLILSLGYSHVLQVVAMCARGLARFSEEINVQEHGLVTQGLVQCVGVPVQDVLQ